VPHFFLSLPVFALIDRQTHPDFLMYAPAAAHFQTAICAMNIKPRLTKLLLFLWAAA